MNFFDLIGQIFWYGILATPLIAFFSVRKLKTNIGIKILCGVIVVAALATLFYFIAIEIILRNGMGT